MKNPDIAIIITANAKTRQELDEKLLTIGIQRLYTRIIPHNNPNRENKMMTTKFVDSNYKYYSSNEETETSQYEEYVPVEW